MNKSSILSISRERVRHQPGVRMMTVTAFRDLGPRLRRVTFSGPMEGFDSPGPDDHVKVFFPDPVTGDLNAPQLTSDGIKRPKGVDLISRDYTPLIREDGTLEMDFVLHGDGGPASHWATRVAVGDTLVLAGPRGSHLPPSGAERYVIGGDETALPAISRWLEVIPIETPVAVLVEVTDAADESYPLPGGRPIQWIHRGATAPGASPLLEEALRALVESEDSVPHDGLSPAGLNAGLTDTFWWFGGEARSLVPVRRYLRRELGLPKGSVDINGYWKSGNVNHDHHAPVDPEDPDE